MVKRVFPKKQAKKKVEDYYGGAVFKKTSPDLASTGTKSLNLEIEYEEGLKLLMALQTCLQQLNRYNRATTEGKSMGLLLSIKMDNSSISVIEKSIRSK
ncbi:MAG: hypothetical protein KF698_07640 [Anaerolineales bacterium]|nr:hypothetical protein [Anaerolineales bacterium]